MRIFSTNSLAALAGGLWLSGPFALMLAATPNDPRFPAQWHLNKINAPAAWNVTTGSRDVVVAVLDTGVNYKNVDIAANMWRNPGETGFDSNGNDKATNGIDDDDNDYIDDVYGINAWDNNGDPMDYGFTRGTMTVPYTHGTACAGVIGAVGNDGAGTVGVSWNVAMMGLRLFPIDFDRDWNNPKVTAAFTRAFEYLLEMKRRGVNIVAISLSGGIPSYSERLYETVNACGREGILTVVAAGNNGLNNDQIGGYLSAFNFQHLIVIGGTLRDDTLGTFSNYGRGTVHLGAPGIDIVTTEHNDFNATSSATPQVSGAIALLKSVMPHATADGLKAAILGSVDQPASLNGRMVSNGRLNVAKALARLTNDFAPAIVVTALPVSPRTRLNHPIQITFSRTMDRASVESNIRFMPAISGKFQWANDDRTVSLVPDEPLLRTNYSAVILRSARDIQGDGLDGNYNGVRQDSSVDDFRWTFGFGVSNDDFENALAITGASGSVRGTTRNASPEVDEPDHAGSRLSAPSVWYRWTAPASGWHTFESLQETAFDTLLGIYTGDSLATIREKAANDNYGGRLQSRMSFEAVANATYFVAVASKAFEANKLIIDDSRMGTFRLSWYPTPPPGFTGSQFSPVTAQPGAVVTLFGTNFTGATAVLFNGISAVFTNAATNNVDLRITAIVPSDATSGPITVVTPLGSATTTGSFGVVRPALSVIESAGAEIAVKWPAANTGFVLEESETADAGPWTAVSGSPLLENGFLKHRLPARDTKRFYRLRK